MLNVNEGAGGTVFGLTSLDPSETNGKTLGVKTTPAVQPRYTFTAAQAHLHRRYQHDREVILDALDGSTFGPIGKQRTRIANCALSPLYVLTDDGKVSIAPGFCRCRMCPTCQARRGRDLSLRVGAILRTLDAPRFVTLTLQAVDHSLKNQLDTLYAAFKQLRGSPFWKAHVRGGVAVVENTWNDQTSRWHPHLHVIVDGSFMPQAALSKEWARVTSGSMIVDIRAIHDRRSAAKYLCDYVAKPVALSTWPPHAINEFAYALNGRRLLITFGTCHRIRVPEDECETRPAIVEPLASCAALVRAHRGGCIVADVAMGLLERCGGTVACAAGRGRGAGLPKLPPLEPWEWDWLAECLRHIAAADAQPEDAACPFADASTVADTPPDARPGTSRPPWSSTTHARVDDWTAPART